MTGFMNRITMNPVLEWQTPPTAMIAGGAFHLPGKHNQATHGKGGKAAVDRKKKVAEVGSALHENWRKSRRQDDGSYEPRIKTTKDKGYIKEHGTDQVDIANTSYEDLPSDWQAENKAAAEVTVRIHTRENGNIDLNDPETRSSVGSEIHDEWLSRNDWAAGGDLDVPFDDLPLDEQIKDIEQMEITLQVLGTGTTASAAFHMPGKHNQKDHGKGGTTGRASGKELKNNKKMYEQRSKKAKTGAAAQGEVASGQEVTAVRRYTGYSDTEQGQSSYSAINRGLRESEGDLETYEPRHKSHSWVEQQAGTATTSRYDAETLRGDIESIDGAMEPIGSDIIVERTVPVSALQGYSPGGSNEGLSWRDHGYSSTSTGGPSVMRFEEARLRGGVEEAPVDVVHMRILVPAGTPAISTDFATHEGEVILPRSSSFMLVGDHGGAGYGGYSGSDATRYTVDVVLLSD